MGVESLSQRPAAQSATSDVGAFRELQHYSSPNARIDVPSAPRPDVGSGTTARRSPFLGRLVQRGIDVCRHLLDASRLVSARMGIARRLAGVVAFWCLQLLG